MFKGAFEFGRKGKGRKEKYKIKTGNIFALHSRTKKPLIMTTQQIANQLADYCRQGKWAAAQEALYATDAISIEPYPTPAFEKETKGLTAIIEKGKKFDSMTEKIHEIRVSDPLVADNSFAFVMGMDITMKGQGRMNMNELCVYSVKDGKITAEEFFI